MIKYLILCLLISTNLFSQNSDSTYISNKKLIEMAIDKRNMRDSINILVQLTDSQKAVINYYAGVNSINDAIIKSQGKQLDIFKDISKQSNSFFNSPTFKFIEGAVYTLAVVFVASKL